MSLTEFPNLPSLWRKLADVLSGLQEPETDAGLTRYMTWLGENPTGPEVSVNATDVLVTFDAPGGAPTYEYKCPKPDDTPSGRTAVMSDPNWRRVIICSADAPADAPLQITLRLDLLEALFPSHNYHAEYIPILYHMTFPWNETAAIKGSVTTWGGSEGVVRHQNGNLFAFSCDSTDIQTDIFGFFTAQGVCVLDPIPWEPYADALVFPGYYPPSASELIHSIDALNDLATAVGKASGRGGGAVDSWGRPIAQSNGFQVTPGPRQYSLDNAIGRLADAVRGYTGCELRVFRRNGNAVSLLDGALVIDANAA